MVYKRNMIVPLSRPMSLAKYQRNNNHAVPGAAGANEVNFAIDDMVRYFYF